MTEERSPAELAAIALRVAEGCAIIVSQGYRTRPTAGKKGPVDLVTEFDLQSESYLRAQLKELTPDIPVLAEEQGGLAVEDLCWYCDPLDGTTNFVHGHPFYAVSIGAMKQGIPVAGAVIAPALNLTWAGYRGGLATRNGEPCHVSQTDILDEALVATGFPTDRRREPDNNFLAWAKVKKLVRGVRRCGSAAIDLCLVADGTYDGYWERNLHAWDLVAGAAIVNSGGGQVTGLDGSAVRLTAGNIVASNCRMHAALVDLLRGC
jgi:myo-inositol-1(or 4)-monophosphatase